MQNYEELYSGLQPSLKSIKDQAGAVARYQKAIAKYSENGNVNELKKSLEALKSALNEGLSAANEMSGKLSGFDFRQYFAHGDFSEQLLKKCEELNIDVQGEKGIYEVFPYKVRVLGDDEHDEELWINRKKFPTYRPSYLAAYLKENREKLYRANFKASLFMEELAVAYEVTCLRSEARIGSSQTLTKIYKNLVPTARARKDYDLQAYAFDLARLYEAGTESWCTKSGQKYTFGTSRDGKTGIRVLSSTGVETFISTIRPLNEENQ